MAANLNTSTYNDGSPIQNLESDNLWTQVNIGGAFCSYLNDPAYDATYGKLYNFYAFAIWNFGGICPAGFGIPTDDDWQSLEVALGMQAQEVNLIGIRGVNENVGGKLKAVSPLWLGSNSGATNETNFTGLPNPTRDGVDGFFNFQIQSVWWSFEYSGGFTPDGYLYVWSRSLFSSTSGIMRHKIHPKSGAAIRCRKNL